MCSKIHLSCGRYGPGPSCPSFPEAHPADCPGVGLTSEPGVDDGTGVLRPGFRLVADAAAGTGQQISGLHVRVRLTAPVQIGQINVSGGGDARALAQPTTTTHS